ncbi:MAG: aminoacetone oxidase family FAD-binding enzyme [Oceanospirillales bacterium]|uniref:TIGR03862 family flavoprotein n=1 Tax=Thalassolituus oleivorans TaxID=187493 RepID=UPI0009493418|nr:TIGR03862 family flavoprotein [Thalassolituus oleivorans]APR67643.1 NAD(FAD)-utilizing dehydrogenase [Thalassolituus oleivorans]PCI46727.1 MAG: aminoacetone oxidase family FAD-binding enzyme [Oceanospirillales bacterium]
MAPPASAQRIAVIGAGPAGLMAAEHIANAGLAVDVFDAMPSVARKFLLAGIGGMNITHAEDYDTLVTRYGGAQSQLKPILDDIPPLELRAWIHALGVDTFVGTSQRVFPTDMKAAPLLRAWLHRLRSSGVTFHPRHRWTGWNNNTPQDGWVFATPDGEVTHQFDAVVLALGGASWAKLGSDGRWCEPLAQMQVDIAPLKPTNCGFEIPWSDFIRERFAGTPLKNIAVSITDKNGYTEYKKGEFVLSEYGIEGSLIYAISAPLRDLIDTNGEKTAEFFLDWLPNMTVEQIIKKLDQPRKGMSFSNVLRKKLNLPALTNALLKECCPTLNNNNSTDVANAIKAMPMRPQQTRPIDEAISSAGGVRFNSTNNDLMLEQLPGVFVAGEMLDWEAPTGGYLLTACFATGKRAGLGLVQWLQE